MPDGRMAQFMIGAQVIDEQPHMLSASMANMIVMSARQAKSGEGVGIHYVVWHPNLPLVPPFDPQVIDPLTQFPWIDVAILKDLETPSRFSYEWKDVKTSRTLIRGGFNLISAVPPPKE